MKVALIKCEEVGIYVIPGSRDEPTGHLLDLEAPLLRQGSDSPAPLGAWPQAPPLSLLAVLRNCHRKPQTGVVGVTVGRSEAEEAAGLDTHQGRSPCPPTITLEASRRLRHSSRRLRRKRDGGSRFDCAEGNERTLLAAGEERKRILIFDGSRPTSSFDISRF